MNIQTIDVYALKNISYLSPIKCADFSEAAAVCLDNQNHKQNVMLTVEGDLEAQFQLTWEEVTQQIKDSRNDMDYSVENGAYCLAMLVIERLTDYKVVKQSKKRTGFDYWLGNKKEALGIQQQARLEVSGILKGTIGQINQRMREKIKQTQKSDNLNIPAYIVVVEFSRPLLKITKR